MTADLFPNTLAARENLQPGAMLLRAFALDEAPALLADVAGVIAMAPFRQMQTPGGQTMSVAMSNCGERGWVSDRRGYRYSPTDPATGAPWPAMPARLADLARRAAAEAGFPGFAPDACLINRYLPAAAWACTRTGTRPT